MHFSLLLLLMFFKLLLLLCFLLLLLLQFFHLPPPAVVIPVAVLPTDAFVAASIVVVPRLPAVAVVVAAAALLVIDFVPHLAAVDDVATVFMWNFFFIKNHVPLVCRRWRGLPPHLGVRASGRHPRGEGVAHQGDLLRRPRLGPAGLGVAKGGRKPLPEPQGEGAFLRRPQEYYGPVLV